MAGKTIKEILHEVDPNLTVVEGGSRKHRRHKKQGEKYYFRSSSLSDGDWDTAAGIVCNGCGQEVFRSRDGLCMPCWEKANEFEVRDRAGVLEFLPASVIMEIARPVRKETEA